MSAPRADFEILGYLPNALVLAPFALAALAALAVVLLALWHGLAEQYRGGMAARHARLGGWLLALVLSLVLWMLVFLAGSLVIEWVLR